MLLFSHWVVSDSFLIPWTVASQALLSMRFPRQECWSGLPFPSLVDCPDLGSEPTSPASQVDSLLLSHQGSSFFSSFVKAFFPGEFCNFMSWLIGNRFPKIRLLRLCSALIVTKYFKNTVINRPRACMQAQLLTSCPSWRLLPLWCGGVCHLWAVSLVSLFQYECDKESPTLQLRSANGCQLAQVRPWLSKGNFGELKKIHTEYNKTESESHWVVSNSLQPHGL